jgi:hypothetical protein
MKLITISLALTLALSALASQEGIICRDDRRMEKGPLKELILTSAEGGYLLQSQFVPSLHSPDIIIENWAEKLACRIDEKSPLAFCETQQGLAAFIKERREVFYDSLEEDVKKKTNRYIDISVTENGVEKKTISFDASHCQTFGGEA